MPSRTFSLHNTLVDAGGAPAANRTITATLIIPAQAVAVDTDGASVVPDPLSVSTDSSGAYSVSLLYPGDLTPAGCIWQINEAGAIVLSPVGFAYASSIDTSTWYSAGGPAGTLKCRLDVVKGDDTAVTGRFIHITPQQNATTPDDELLSVSVPLDVALDGTGRATFWLWPSSDLDPSTNYACRVDGETTRISFSVPTSTTDTAGENIIDHLVPFGAAQPNQLSPVAVAHSAQVPPLTSEPEQTPASLDEDLENLVYRIAHTTGGGGGALVISDGSTILTGVTKMTSVTSALTGTAADAYLTARTATTSSKGIVQPDGSTIAINSSGVISATGAGGSMTNPMTTPDDIIVGGTSGAPARLGKGADGQVLTVDPTSHHLLWATPASYLTNPMTAQDDLIAGGTGGAPARLAKGADAQLLGVDPATHHLGWLTPSAPGMTNPMTALGDLIAGGTSGASNRLPVGTNGQVLTADSAQTLGVKWATPAAGAGGASALAAGKVTLTSGDFVTASTTFVNIPGAALTITTGARRVLVGWSLSAKSSTTAQNAIDLLVDGARQGQTFGLVLGQSGTVGQNFDLSGTFLTDILGAGSHTVQLVARVDAATGTFYASPAVSPLVLWAQEQADSVGAGGMTKLAEVLLSTAQPTISFPSIPGGYRHLKLLGQLGVASSNSADRVLQLQVNGDSASHYRYIFRYDNGSSPGYVASNTSGDTKLVLPDLALNGSDALAATGYEISLPNYAGSLNKQVECVANYGNAAATSIFWGGGSWAQAAAVSALAFSIGSGANFCVGSVLTLYGYN